MTTDSNTSTHTAPRLTDLPARDVLAVDGAGRPEDAAFTTAIAALFGTRAALGEAAESAIAVTDRAPGRLAGVSGRVRAEALDEDTGALCRAAIESGAVTGREPLVAVFPLDVTDEFDVAVGVPAADGETVLQGGAWATTLHVGPYARLPLAYAALLEHVRAHGHTPTGPVTETYLTDPATVVPEELVTRLAVALDGA
jgi:hypothetical protein